MLQAAQPIVVISIGAALGALLRWVLGTSLNHAFPALPPGTLLANLIGGYLVGMAVAVLGQMPELSPAWRLFVITGFLGGLTTFSTFSAEVVLSLQQGRVGWALAAVATHLVGSLVLTVAGLASGVLLAGVLLKKAGS